MRSILSLLLIFACALPTYSSWADTVIVIQNNFGAQRFGFQFSTSNPYNYEKLDSSPDEVSITFTQPPELETSSIEVTNMFGAQVNNAPLQVNENTLSVALPPKLPVGRYKVKWKAQCHCAERIRLNDVFRFTIR